MYYHHNTQAAQLYTIDQRNQLANATIQNLNYEVKGFTSHYQYEPDKRHNSYSLTVKSNSQFNHYGAWSTRRTFEQFELDYLHLNIRNDFPISALNQTRTRELKLIGSNQIQFNKPITIQGLEKLVIATGQYPEQQLRQYIKSNKPYSIIQISKLRQREAALNSQ